MNTSDTHTINPRVLLIALMLGLAAIVFNRPSTPPPDVNNITVQMADTLIKQGAMVIDVRGAEAFGERHIPGALNFPLDVLRDGIPASMASSIAKPVVVYCGDGSTLGPEGTALLNKAGYTKAVNLEHGMQGWATAGLPIAK